MSNFILACGIVMFACMTVGIVLVTILLSIFTINVYKEFKNKNKNKKEQKSTSCPLSDRSLY